MKSMKAGHGPTVLASCAMIFLVRSYMLRSRDGPRQHVYRTFPMQELGGLSKRFASNVGEHTRGVEGFIQPMRASEVCKQGCRAHGGRSIEGP
eukprot:325353-Pelagomonas_calceolata.AAC.2